MSPGTGFIMRSVRAKRSDFHLHCFFKFLVCAVFFVARFVDGQSDIHPDGCFVNVLWTDKDIARPPAGPDIRPFPLFQHNGAPFPRSPRGLWSSLRRSRPAARGQGCKGRAGAKARGLGAKFGRGVRSLGASEARGQWGGSRSTVLLSRRLD